MFAKCSDESCCKPWRSNLKALFPTGFMPPPVAVERDPGGGFKLMDPAKVNPSTRLVDPLLARSIGLRIDDIPFDLYLPSAQKHIPQRTCPVCRLYFPSRAQMVKHRVALHYRTRQKLPGDFEASLTEFKPNDVSMVYGRVHNAFKVILNSGHSDVMALDESHSAVQEFIQTCEAEDSAFSVFEAWLQNFEYMSLDE